MMKKFAMILGVVIGVVCLSHAQTVVDIYQFKMSLNVPRIYDNTSSLGYRKYQRQTLSGELRITYKDDGDVVVQTYGLVNRTHKVNKRSISYESVLDDYSSSYPVIVAIGNNMTGKFSTGGVKFNLVAFPSYALGDEANEDNSLYLELSGNGKMKSYKSYGCSIPATLSGSVTGQIGCGCTDYGHISPTRLYKGFTSTQVIDIAPLYGTWTAKFRYRQVR